MRLDQKLISLPCQPEQIGGHNEELAFILELSNLLAALSGPEAVLEAALRLVRDRFDFGTGRLYLYDESRGELVLQASQGLDVSGLESMPADQGFSGMAFSRRSFLAKKIEDLPAKERVERLKSRGLKSVVCVPLIVRDQAIGVMNLGARRVVHLETEHIDLMIVAANIIAVAVQNSQATETLERQKEAIRFFAYTASHDLKGPVVGIGGMVRLLAKHEGYKFSERGVEICRQLENASARLEMLVGEINSYISASEAPMDMDEVDMGQIINDVCHDFSLSMEQRGVQLRVPPKLPKIRADKLGLMRIFENLVDNALKYGGGNLSLIQIDYQESDCYHTFSVADNGVGLTADQAEKIFDVFSRSETSKGSPGSGLGLGIVRAVAKRHGGTAWADCAPGRGCTFYVTIAKSEQ